MGKLMLEIVTLIARVHDRILAFNAARSRIAASRRSLRPNSPESGSANQ